MQAKPTKPFNIRQAARKLTPGLLENLPGILPGQLEQQAKELKSRISHHAKGLNTTGNKPDKGYTVLVSGPPGTGKAFIAQLLAGGSELPVYQIDLSKLVPAYIGETEKNLQQLFARAQKKDWILFFDEADALFGKRTAIDEAHDRYANLETAYLWQQIESYRGLVIIAANSANDFNDDCLHRFDAVLRLPFQGPPLRF